MNNPNAKAYAQALTNQQKYEQELNKTLDDTYLIIEDDETKTWYEYAKYALRFASPISLSMQTNRYLEILQIYKSGIKYTDVAALCNNLSARTPHEMNMTIKEYMEMMKINFKMVQYYNSIVLPLMSKLQQKYGIGQPSKIVTLNGTRN